MRPQSFLRSFGNLLHKHRVNKIPDALPRQFRSLPAEREQVEGANRFAFALSSETPADQWFGREVLKHTDGAIRQDRLKGGIPLLFNHDPDQHLGVVDGYSIKSGKLRVEGRWGSSDLAQQKKRDYDDGILKDSSVGYMIHKIVRDQEGEDPSPDDTLNVTDWEPVEASLVTIPADPTVGAGRSNDSKAEFPVAVEVSRRDLPTAAPAAKPNVEVREMADENLQQKLDENKAEIARRDRIIALASDKDFGKHVSMDDVKRALDSGESAEKFTETLTRKIVAASDASKVGTVGNEVMKETGKDAKRYSLAKAFRYAISQTKPHAFTAEDYSFEREVSSAIAKRTGQQTLGIFIPNGTRTVTAAATGTGLTAQTATIATQTESDVIPMYRNKPQVLALGATRLGGLSGIVRMPRQTGAGSAQWLAETVGVTASDISTDFITLSPKRLSIQNIYTVELLAESAVDVEGLLAADRDKVMQLAIDSAALLPGTGATPNGLLGQSGLATITTTGTALATGKSPSYSDILSFESKVAAANADTASMAWLMTPEARGLLKGTPMFPNGYAMPIWPTLVTRGTDGVEDGPLGYRAAVSNQVPKNFGANANLHAIIFGDFSNILVADWGASELIVDPYTQAASGAYVVTERVLMDVEVRHIQPFVVSETVAVS